MEFGLVLSLLSRFLLLESSTISFTMSGRKKRGKAQAERAQPRLKPAKDDYRSLVASKVVLSGIELEYLQRQNEFRLIAMARRCETCAAYRSKDLHEGAAEFATVCILDGDGRPTNENYVIVGGSYLKKIGGAYFGDVNVVDKVRIFK